MSKYRDTYVFLSLELSLGQETQWKLSEFCITVYLNHVSKSPSQGKINVMSTSVDEYNKSKAIG